MKKLLGLFALFAMATAAVVAPASGADPVFFEGEGFVVPTEKSQSGVASDFRLRQNHAAPPTVRLTVDDSGFPEIEVFATVLDADGNPVTGLPESAFEVLEQSELEGVPTAQSLTCFEEVAESGDGVRFSLTFDVSQSMSFNNRLSDAKVAATDFLANTNPEDQGSLVSFSGCDQGGIQVPLTTVGTDTDGDGTSDLAAGISALAPISLTALFDGINDALDTLADAPFPKGVIVFTDGQSNADCQVTLAEVIERAQIEGIPVYTIGLALDPGSPAELQLQQIAQETGGAYTPAPTAADMAAIYQDVPDTIRSQYRIRYATHNPAFDGTERTVTVTADDISGTGSYIVGDVPANRPPVIDHSPVTTGIEGQPIEIAAGVTDPDPEDTIASVTLFYRPMDGGRPDSYVAVPMVPGDGDQWMGQIPGDAVTPVGLEYYIRAEDSRMAVAEAGGATNPFPITVSPAGPQADAGPNQGVTEGESVSLDGSGSTTSLPDGVLTYFWRQIGGPGVGLSDPTAVFPTFTAPDVGPAGAVLTFELTVTDAQGRSDTDSVEVTLNDRMAPAAAFDFAPADPEAGEAVQFTDQSVPADDAIVAWAWDFGGRGTSDQANPMFTFPDPGTYTVRLTVTDANGATGTAVRQISVIEPPCLEQDCGGGSGGCFLRTLSAESRGDSVGASIARAVRRWMDR